MEERPAPVLRAARDPLAHRSHRVPLAPLERYLREWGLDEDVRVNGQLIVSEFAGHAVRHGSPPARLRLIFDQVLTIEVTATGGNAPLLRHAQEGDEGGRGLFIVSQLADRW
ncbi:ATP-binding protein, partial [Streptomyces sp. NPDC058459]|uniref:ATP-binding protein n=1 Tax=Streptomyces sp. NPDC058459 TaxID=3346508 RepID=UPI003654B2A0